MNTQASQSTSSEKESRRIFLNTIVHHIDNFDVKDLTFCLKIFSKRDETFKRVIDFLVDSDKKTMLSVLSLIEILINSSSDDLNNLSKLTAKYCSAHTISEFKRLAVEHGV